MQGLRANSDSGVFGSRVFASFVGAPGELLAAGAEPIRASDFGGLGSWIIGAGRFLSTSECARVCSEGLFEEAVCDGSV